LQFTVNDEIVDQPNDFQKKLHKKDRAEFSYVKSILRTY